MNRRAGEGSRSLSDGENEGEMEGARENGGRVGKCMGSKAKIRKQCTERGLCVHDQMQGLEFQSQIKKVQDEPQPMEKHEEKSYSNQLRPHMRGSGGEQGG